MGGTAPMIRSALPADVPAVLSLIRDLARYEKLEHGWSARAESLREHLFGANPGTARWSLAEDAGAVVGVRALLPQLLDVPCKPGPLPGGPLRPARAPRHGPRARRCSPHVAQLALERGCGRFEWARARLERTGHRLLRVPRRETPAGLAHLPGHRRGAGEAGGNERGMNRKAGRWKVEEHLTSDCPVQPLRPAV